MLSATFRLLGRPVRMVCDPIAQVCYPVLEEHWMERYRKPWPTKYARRMLILDMTLLTIIATLIVTAMIYYFIVPLFALPAIVNVDALAPKILVSGQATEYDVAYRNDSERQLGCAVLRVHLPAGTVPETQYIPTGAQRTFCPAPGQGAQTPTIESDGADGPVLLFPLGNVPPHGRDLLKVRATTYGPTGTLKVMTSELLYWEEAETAPTRVSARNEWRIDHSVISLDAAAPAGTGSRTVTFSYANVLDDKVGPVVLRVQAPDDFIVTGSSMPQLAQDEWSLGMLDAKTRGTLTLTGRFKEAQGPRPPATFAVNAYAQVNGKEYLLEGLRRNVDPKTTGFSIGQTITYPGRDALLPGEDVKLTVHYQNDGPQALRDVTVRIIADPRFATADSPAQLAWDKTNAPQLARVAPGAGGDLEAQFTVVRDITQESLGTDAAPVLRLSSVAGFALENALDDRLTVDSAETDMPVATKLDVSAAGLYFTKDGDQVGIGPLPPQVGQTTKYRVFIDVTNTSGEAREVTLDATLPPNVQWTGRYSVNAGQAIDWLPSSRTVRWNLGTVPAFTNSEGEHLGASFEVALTPRAKDAGSAQTLVSDIVLNGKDAATGLSLHATAEPVTTDLPFDKRAAGKGTVEK